MLRLLLLFLSVNTFVFSSLAEPITLPLDKATNKWSGHAEVISQGSSSEYLVVTTEGTHRPAYLTWELSEPVNLNKALIETYIKVSDFENWQGIELRVSDSDDVNSYFAIPIIRYSDVHFNWVQAGSWLRITLSLGEAQVVGTPNANNIRYVSWYINDSGKDKLQVSFSGTKIVSAVHQPLLSVTFDDGYIETLFAAEVMDTYGMRGTSYIIPNSLDRAGYLSVEDVDTLYKKYRWGISAHHEIPFTEFAPGPLNTELHSVFKYLIDHGYGFSAPHLAYPLGRYNTDYIIPIVSQNVQTARIAGGGGETLPPADWHRLRTVNITPDITPDVLRQRILKAQEHNEWLILMFHHLTPYSPQNDLEYNKDEFKELVRVIFESGIQTLPVHEVWEAHRVD